MYLKKMEHVAGSFSEGEIKHVTTLTVICNHFPFAESAIIIGVFFQSTLINNNKNKIAVP